MRWRWFELDPLREFFRRQLAGERLVQIEKETASVGAIALRAQAARLKRLHRADLDFLPERQRNFRLGSGQTGLENQTPGRARRERFNRRKIENVASTRLGFRGRCGRGIAGGIRLVLIRWRGILRGLAPSRERTIVALPKRKSTVALARIIRLLDPCFHARAGRVHELAIFRRRGRVHIGVKEDEETREDGGVILFEIADNAFAFDTKRRCLRGLVQGRGHEFTGGILRPGTQRDFKFRPERQNAVGRETSTARAQPDEAPGQRRIEDQRRNVRGLADLSRPDHFADEAKLEGAVGGELPRRQQKLHGRISRQERGETEKRKSEAEVAKHRGAATNTVRPRRFFQSISSRKTPPVPANLNLRDRPDARRLADSKPAWRNWQTR